MAATHTTHPHAPAHMPAHATSPAPAMPDDADAPSAADAPEKAKLTAACRAWIRKEIELFAAGHSEATRKDTNP